ncbi:hypothetical protein HK097_011087 [Rhizophlyctis rosea]|uniref:Nucleotide-diphospho-sugar transferase n=1 Tax=Rhizophlyctis rosea TaxID=64517 RepID=A0AAD5S8G9_9FUNG|nr:hypothetical protein HK097_011087 [Rhizophlyctis rosea]
MISLPLNPAAIPANIPRTTKLRFIIALCVCALLFSAHLVVNQRYPVPDVQTALPKQRFAYVTYVTSEEYVCTTLVMFDSLLAAGKRKDVDLVALVTQGISVNSTARIEGLGARIVKVDVIRTLRGDETWKESLTKMFAFKLIEYERIILMDADGIILKPLDFLFDLPPYFLYAPRAYWLSDVTLTSILYVIQTSEALYTTQYDILKAAEAISKPVYDMDIANEAFAKTAALLPNGIAILNGDFKRSPSVKAPSHLFWNVSRLAEEVKYVHWSESPMGNLGVDQKASFIAIAQL